MLATLVNEPFDDKQRVFETKRDGFRITEKHDSTVRLWSRNGIDVSSRYAVLLPAVGTENLICVDDVRESPKLTRWLPFYALYLPSWSCPSRRGAGSKHQLIVLRRQLRGRVRLTNYDRLFFIQLYRWFPSILKVLTIVRPETLIRWHRAGFRRYWRWKSRALGGRPQIEADLRALIRRMSTENPLWGAPRIHGELLKLGFEVAQSSVAKYMVKRFGPPSQGWRAFLRKHAPDIAAMDLFVVPTVGFNLLYGFIIVRLDRRDLVWINVTANPTAEWIARQITEAFPWNEAPRHLIRDRDRIYGTAVTRRLRAMGASGTSQLHQRPLGRTALLNG